MVISVDRYLVENNGDGGVYVGIGLDGDPNYIHLECAESGNTIVLSKEDVADIATIANKSPWEPHE